MTKTNGKANGKKRKYVNDIHRSRMIFQVQRLIKDMDYKEVEEISRRNGHKGVHRSTVRALYKKPSEGGTMWPSSRTLESIIYSVGGKIKIVQPGEEE
jgi:hypothetical protein